MEAARVVKQEGKENDLLDRILASPIFGLTQSDLDRILNLQKFVGRAPEQVAEFVENEVRPALKAIPGWSDLSAGEVKV